MGRSMRYRVFGPGLSGRFLKTAWAVLVIPAVLACGLFSGDPAPSPTLPSDESPTATDEGSPKGEPGTGIEFEPKATPLPTATPYPTATPFPTATPYPTPAPLPTASPTPTPAAESPVSTPVAIPTITDVSAASPTPTPAAATASSEATPTPTAEAAPVVSSPVPAPTSTAVVVAPPGSSTGTNQITIPEKTELKYPKVGSMLDDLIARVEAGEVTAEDAAAEAPLHRGDSVAVTIYLSRNVDGVVRFLQDNGVSPRNVGEDYIEAFIPILLLPQISEQQGVLRVEEAIPAEPFQGGARISGNGPAVHGSPAWNQDGYRGQGIKVGIIDNGFEGFSGFMGTELPQSVRARCYPEGSDTPTNGITDCARNGSHGTAVAESVMDIAPDVSLYVANALSKGDLQAAVQWMIDQGVNVINHSVGWPFDGPGDGTSPNSWSPLRSVDRAVDSGIVWVNAAGNDARTTWFGPPSDADEDGAIEFAAEDERNGFVLSCDVTRCALRIQLRWDDSWDAAVRDLDLYIYDLDDNIELRSEREQSGSNGHALFESIYVEGSGAFYIRIVNRRGSLPSWIQLTLWGNVVVEHYTETGSVTNPAESANPGLLTVGAARWSNVSSIESFSSLGPTPDGRIKPDVVGADCGEVKSYPEVIAGCWRTSAARPRPMWPAWLRWCASGFLTTPLLRSCPT